MYSLFVNIQFHTYQICSDFQSKSLLTEAARVTELVKTSGKNKQKEVRTAEEDGSPVGDNISFQLLFFSAEDLLINVLY